MKPDLLTWGPPPTSQHRRVVAGPVLEEVACLSIQEFEARVPAASSELHAEAQAFFWAGSGELVVVPGKVIAPAPVQVT